MKEQRASFINTLSNDIILNAKSANQAVKWDQIAAGKKAFKKHWNNFPFRIGINLILPLLMLCADVIMPIKYIFIVIFRKKKKCNFKRLFIGHDRRLYTISERIKLPKKDDVWLRLIDDNFIIPKEKKQAHILDFISPYQVIKSAYQSIIIHALAITNLGYSTYFLSYKAFKWCLMDYALRNIPKNVELIHSYICDRNAILIDKLPHSKKILIQHGTMHFGNNSTDHPYLKYKPEKGFYIWTSLYRSSWSKVYCYTDIDEWALSKSVIANNPEFIHINYGFTPSFKPDKKSILIVSNYYSYGKFEESIIGQLQNLDIEIYLKNHPSHANSLYDDMRSKYQFNFIAGLETTLPAVDLLISYDSTLAYEYASIGTPVFYYGHFDINDIKTLVLQKLSLEK